MKKAKHIINAIVWTFVALYLTIVILVNVSPIQRFLGHEVASALSAKLGTRVEVGRVSIGFLNRAIVDGVFIEDQQHQPMLRATRLSAKISYLELLRGRITITSAQFFGLRAQLLKASADAPLNIQFVLDSLASKDTTKHTPLHLAINSLVIRHGYLTYDQTDEIPKPSFDTHHFNINDLSSHIILNTLQDDSINLQVKRLSMNVDHHLYLQKLSFRFIANRHEVLLKDFRMELPNSQLALGDFRATYRFNNKVKHLEPTTLQFTGSIEPSHITPTDLAHLVPALTRFRQPIALASTFSGTSTTLRLGRFYADMPSARGHHAPSAMHAVLSGSATKTGHNLRWAAAISDISVSDEGLKMISGSIPAAVVRLGNIHYAGQAGGYGHDLSTKGILATDAGRANIALGLHDGNFAGRLETTGLNLGQILDNRQLGLLASRINVDGNIRQQRYKADGTVSRIDYNGYSYRNINLDAAYNRGLVDGWLKIDDPNIQAAINGKANVSQSAPSANLTADIQHFNPSAVHLLEGKFPATVFGANITVNLSGRNINSLQGQLDVNNFTMQSPEKDYVLKQLHLEAGNDATGHFVRLQSDFADATVTGRFDYTTLSQSLQNLIVRKLPSLQQLTSMRYRPTPVSNFTMDARVTKADWIRQFFNVNLELQQPLTISVCSNTAAQDVEATIMAPEVVYNNGRYRNVAINLATPDDQLTADVRLTRMRDEGIGTDLALRAIANDDQLSSVITLDNHDPEQRLRARFNADTQLLRNSKGFTEARIGIGKSDISIGDTILKVHPATVVYSNHSLAVNHLSISGTDQFLTIDGAATRGSDDSLTVRLGNVNVAYVLDLIDFHSVSFGGGASGVAHVSHLFENPTVRADLDVDRFTFTRGRMGRLLAKANWNKNDNQVNIQAQAVDTMNVGPHTTVPRRTDVNGYVSIKQKTIDLDLGLHNTRVEFIQTICSSFMSRADISGTGRMRLWGGLKRMSLTGMAVCNGVIGIKPLNTDYTLRNDTVIGRVNDISFTADSIYDRNGNHAIVNGHIRHNYLHNFTCDFDISADHLLAYDWDGNDGSTFYGTCYATGRATISTRPGQVDIDINVRPDRGTLMYYDNTSPGRLSKHDFIHWSDRDSVRNEVLKILNAESQMQNTDLAGSSECAPAFTPVELAHAAVPSSAFTTNIFMNFLIDATPDAAFRVVMDKQTGDYIELNGNGTLKANYSDKGGVDIFGTYAVDHGVYKLTIQNLIKKDFSFRDGGTIVFGGDPMNATLNLQAVYSLPAVSLSDLQVGRNFTNNNIRVDCLMDITGMPSEPKVSFGLDMPTVGTDAKQMIYSLLNSQDEMNQQVLYLLAVGRFYSQGTNNAEATSGTSQTSLAMQSILSGQVSQQINTVLSSVIKNNNWNFGTNISTGDEGWNNAEYEGLLSGRMLNNRLLFNGQFGYRDNPNATTSFIGDFDVRYLITPNGNVSIRVYNQTNDRYFTRNSLNTQGLGFILKKDFNGWRDLLGLRNKKLKVPYAPAGKPN